MGTPYTTFQSAGICETLLFYTRFENPNSRFHKYHYSYPKEAYGSQWDFKKFRFPNPEDLKNFLKATNDEVRLKKADSYSTGVLYIPDMQEASYFRDAIMRKELSADLDFNKQRDHAAHTLYNYLLGWYFYENCTPVRENLNRQIRKRDFNLFNDNDEKNIICAFGTIWTYASLLHDIGYLLEGSLPNLSLDVEVAHVTKGAAIIHDYFNHYFWKDIDLDFHAARDVVKHINLHIPDFKNVRSISALSDHLSVMGDCEPIRMKLESEINELNDNVVKAKYLKILNNPNKLDIDSFKLWELHFSVYGNKESKKMVDKISDIYKDLVWDGLPQSNSRTINHAVASGLLSLMFSTYFYQILFGFQKVEDFKNHITDQLVDLGNKINSVNNSLKDQAITRKIVFQSYKALVNNIKNSIITGYEFGVFFKDYMLLELLDSLVYEIDYFNSTEDDEINEIIYLHVKLSNLINDQLETFYKRYNYKSVSKFIRKTSIPKHFTKYTALNWFSLVLWGTAAAAIHDIVQNKKIWDHPKHESFLRRLKTDRGGKDGLLSLEESPLCYLGVLVDVIQEWDRYSVKKDDIFSLKERLQGVQVDIKPLDDTMNKLHLTFPDNDDLKNDIEKTLNFSLVNWKNYLKIND